MKYLEYGYVDDEVYMGELRYYSFQDAARIINCKGLGRNKLLALMRESNLLEYGNKPTEESLDNLFIKSADDFFQTPLISSYGINYVKKYLISKGQT